VDALSDTAEALFDELNCPKQFVQFTDAEAAGGHCETQVRTRFQQISLDCGRGVCSASLMP